MRFSCLFVCAAMTVGCLGQAMAQDVCSTSQWVRLTDSDVLVGEVVGMQGGNQMEGLGQASYSLVAPDGTVQSGVSSTKGRFRIRGVKPGIYTLAASTESSFGVMSLHVIGASQLGADRYPEIAMLSVANVGMDTVKQAMGRYMDGSWSGGSIADVDLVGLADRVCTSFAYQVMQSDGGMVGKLYLPGAVGESLVPAPKTNVFVFQNGFEVARGVTDDQGEFSIEALEPGVYGFMAAGTAGFSVMGFELVSANAGVELEFSSKVSSTTLVAEQNGPSDSFGSQLTDVQGARIATEDQAPGDAVENEVVGETPLAGLSIPPGSYIGGGGFGGGGGFAGGDFGGLATLAGLGGLIAATVGDDDDNNFVTPVVPVPVSPASP